MTASLDSPTLGRALRALERRVRDLERALTTRLPTTTPKSQRQEAVFSYAGTLTVATSPRWYPRTTARLTQVVASLATAGTSDTVVTVYVNGTSVGTLTLRSGVTKASGSFTSALTADTDHLRVGVTTVGTGAADLTVQARLA